MNLITTQYCWMYMQVMIYNLQFTIYKYMYMYQYTVNSKSFFLLFQETIWRDMQEGCCNSWIDHNERCSYRSVRVCSRRTSGHQASGVSKWRRLVWILWTTRGIKLRNNILLCRNVLGLGTRKSPKKVQDSIW